MTQFLAWVAVLLLATACTRAADDPSQNPALSPSFDPATAPASAPLSPRPTPTPPSPSPSLEPLPGDPELRHVVELRRSFGLRADLAYVTAVADNPDATTSLLEIPLLPNEAAELNDRQANADVVAPVVRTYSARHEDEYAGIYIDHESGGDVMTLWTGHIADHETAIRARLPAGSRVAFRLVEFSERYLRGLQDQITAEIAPEADWLAAIPARLQSIGVDIIRNRAFVTVSSANPDAADLIEAHFDMGEALIAESDGTGVALVPWGEVVGKVRTEAGKLPPAADYLLMWHGSIGLDCGGGDMGYGVAEDGSFKLPCQVGTWTIAVNIPSGDGWRPIGEGTVDVPANDTVRLDIVLTAMP